MSQLEGKVAIVTGASSGIGYEAAKLFAAEGARLVVVARRREELDRLVEEIAARGGEAVAVAGDVRDDAVARAAVEAAEGQFGGLDIAFNNAGLTGPAVPVTGLDEADWRMVLDVNLTAAFLGARHQIPAMIARGGGSLIFTASFVGAVVGFPMMGAYAAAKAGVVGLTRAIAAEYGQQGIRANALLPGGTDTPMGRAAMPDPAIRAHVEGLHALKRLAEPAEIARSALYLAGNMSSFTTGTALVVDGGVSAVR
ncbi:MAG: short-chain dehydrogenase [Tistrella sp.]|uniref:Short-chain dehydrogenase n=1 Tax=Tistrella mobilis TaxID=171437 RepID=A0A3B9IPP3_9PROT|nr:SDR family oxidoreductase [Tistrella sp.]MAD39289.1 short-chain dehydrogenase [Tistrella sp.]MBA76305.1 short-chain dehydrogenase [Tistrella sp.]HAE49710.1 short-chain dehydrogenase [Tistrella mobilis]